MPLYFYSLDYRSIFYIFFLPKQNYNFVSGTNAANKGITAKFGDDGAGIYTTLAHSKDNLYICQSRCEADEVVVEEPLPPPVVEDEGPPTGSVAVGEFC